MPTNPSRGTVWDTRGTTGVTGVTEGTDRGAIEDTSGGGWACVTTHLIILSVVPSGRDTINRPDS